VIFDFPVRYKKARYAFWGKLRDFEFYQLQRSVWVSPYPCEEEILFTADFFGVGKYVDILEVKKIITNKNLKKHFGL